MVGSRPKKPELALQRITIELSRALDWEPTRVVTEGGSVAARHVVMATHLPLGQVGGYYALAHPKAEPVLAARIGRIPDGMYLNAGQPSHSIRTHARADGDVYGIAVGQSFKPGDTAAERVSFEELERWLGEHFEPGPIEHRWVNEDYTPVDGAPFIGWSSSIADGYLVARASTPGHRQWHGRGHDSRRPRHGQGEPLDGDVRRQLREPVAGAAEFVKGNAGVAAHLVSGYLSKKPESFESLARGEAAILDIKGGDVAAFRDEDGEVHAVSAACTHMGCVVGWNSTDRTWDCPCHGSRFALDREVFHGPATKPLGSGITG